MVLGGGHRSEGVRASWARAVLLRVPPRVRYRPVARRRHQPRLRPHPAVTLSRSFSLWRFFFFFFFPSLSSPPLTRDSGRGERKSEDRAQVRLLDSGTIPPAWTGILNAHLILLVGTTYYIIKWFTTSGKIGAN